MPAFSFTRSSQFARCAGDSPRPLQGERTRDNSTRPNCCRNRVDGSWGGDGFVLGARIDYDRRQCRENDAGGEHRESLSGSREELCHSRVDRCVWRVSDRRRILVPPGFLR